MRSVCAVWKWPGGPVGAALVMSLLVGISGCGTPADKARSRLKKAGVSPTPNALVAAAQAGQLEIAGWLLMAGIPVSSSNAAGKTALGAATENNQPEMVSLLLDAGADVNAADASGTPPLAYALRIPSQGMISLLLEQGASGNISIRGGEPALVHAVRGRDIRLADSLIRAGAKVDARAADGWIGLPLAVSHEDEAMAVALVNAKANPDLKTPAGDVPLTMAVRATNASLVSLLLRHKADPSAADPRGQTPLDAAVAGGDNTLVGMLYKAGAKSKNSEALLAIAIDRGNHPLVSMILEHGANPDLEVPGHKLPMQVALERNDMRLVRSLLDAKANPTPWLVPAITNRSAPLIDMLLKAKADPNHTGGDNDPPLCIALRQGDLRLAEKLLHAGANPSLRGAEGQTPLAVAVARRQTQAVELLLSYKADPNATLAEPVSPAFVALLGKGTVRHYVQKDSAITPLMISAAQGDLDTTRALLAAKASQNVRSKRYKRYPINFAAEGSHTEVMQMLLGKDPSTLKGARIEVDLSEQRARIWKDGKVKFSCPVSTGRSGFRTPKGEYVITNKYKHWISTIYHMPMPYFMRLSCGNFGLHAGYVPGFPASHGCIRVPPEFARTLFSIADLGYRVTITD